MNKTKSGLVDKRSIRALSRRIAEEFHPDKIILFGSYAYGKPTADSDVDLMVIMPHEGHPVDKATEIHLRARPGFPLDLLVRTREKVRERIEMGDDFMEEIVTRGEVLYEAHDN
jgi:uncharacterized protein